MTPTMAYQKPHLAPLSLDVGASCCTPENHYSYCETPPSCKVLGVTVLTGQSCNGPLSNAVCVTGPSRVGPLTLLQVSHCV